MGKLSGSNFDEAWKWVPGQEGKYMASSYGRIMSFVKGPPNIMSPWPSKMGYYYVRLGRAKNVSVHTLVAKAFIENKREVKCVNHKNGITSDNRVENLEWVTHSENSLHAIRTGLTSILHGSDTSIARSIACYDGGNKIKEYGAIVSAKEDGYFRTGIKDSIRTGVKYKGVTWQYTTERKWKKNTKPTPDRKFGCFKLSGDVIEKEYNRVSEAVSDGFHMTAIYRALKDSKIRTGGFYWKYL